MKKNILSYSFVFLLLVLFTFSFSFISHKAEALTISPARMELSGDQGTTVTKDITLINDTASDATYYVTYANFESQGETGSPLFVEPKSDLGTWMTTDKSVTLAPQESKVVPVTITIPKDAYAGGHFAVVFFGNAPSGGGQVSVGAKTGTLILLTVNGDVLEAGGLASFNTLKHKYFYNSLPISFEFRWKNDGNDRVKPDGNISIRSLFFIPVGHIDANAVSGNILPHSTRLFNIDWIKLPADKNDNIKSASFINSYFKIVSFQWHNFAVGPYLAHLDLVSGIDKIHSTKNVIFFVFPWQLLLLMVIILIPIFFIGRFALRRYNKKIIEKARLGMNTPSDANNG
jgi:hypothetical protein